jgi:uncharacterized protein (TIGR02266 family)
MARRRQAPDTTADTKKTGVESEVAALGGNERRSEPRVELSIEIGIDDHTNFYVGFSENVSVGGLFIATYRLMPIGTEVAVTFVLPDEFPVFVHGAVRWLREPRDTNTSPANANAANADSPPGMGIEFAELGEAELTRIQAYINTRRPMFYPDRG